MLLVLLVVLTASPAPQDSPVESPFHPPTKSLLAIGVGTVALGVGSAIGAWADRDGGFGRACSIVGGSLGLAALGGYLAAAIVALFETEPFFRDFGQSLYGFIGAGIGLVVGAVVAGFLSAPPGTQRGVLGLAGGSVATIGGAHLVVVSFVGPFSD